VINQAAPSKSGCVTILQRCQAQAERAMRGADLIDRIMVYGKSSVISSALNLGKSGTWKVVGRRILWISAKTARQFPFLATPDVRDACLISVSGLGGVDERRVPATAPSDRAGDEMARAR
jgi:hypothetical protein